MPGWVAVILVIAAGSLGVLAFPRFTWWWCAPLSLLVLCLAARGRSAVGGAGLGFLHGLALLLPLLSWTGIQVGAFPWVALASAEAAFHAFGGWGFVVTARVRPMWLRVLGTAAVWVAVEAAQARIPFGGFGWSSYAFTQVDAPTIGLAALGGTPAVTFALGLIVGAIAEFVSRLREHPRPWQTPGVSLALLGIAAAAVLAPLLVPLPTAAQAGSLTVAGIQGSVPKLGLDFNAQRRAVLDKHANETLALAEDIRAGRVERPDLMIWPENSSDIDPFRNRDAYQVIGEAVDAVDTPTLLGTLVYRDTADGGGVYNTVLEWRPGEGPVASYAKRAPVPFAEYVPYRAFFRAITPLVDQAGNFLAGDQVGLMPVRTRAGTVPVGVLICFEVVPDRLVADVVDSGASILVVPTNNATFGMSDESRQQLAISRFRAIEYGRSVAQVSTVGVSGLIAPDGTVVDGSPLFVPTTLQAALPLRTDLTVAARVGEGPEWVLVAVAALAMLLGLRTGRRVHWSRSRPRREPSTS